MGARFLDYTQLFALGLANGKSIVSSNERFVAVDTPSVPATIFGVSTSASAATNTAALNQAITEANAAGGGEIFIPPGTYNFAVTGSAVVRPGASNPSKSAITMKANTYLRGSGPGTILQLAASQNTNAAYANLFKADPGVSNLGLFNMTLKGNTANQPGYTGGYGQGDTGGTLLALGDSTGGVVKLLLSGLYLEDAFGAAADIARVTDVLANDITVDKTGEGFQLNGYTNAKVFNYTYLNSTLVSVGDALELVNGTDLILDGFNIVNSQGGSALDITGRNVILVNGRIRNGGVGVVLQYDAADPNQPNSDNWLLSNISCKNMVDQAFILTGGSNGNFRGTISDCRAENCQTGFLLGNTTGNSEVYVNDCTAIGCTIAGLAILAINRVIVRGGHYSRQATGAYGIMLANRTGADRLICDIEGVRSEDNDRFGVYVEHNTHYPKGRVHVYAKNNSTGDMSYFNQLDGRSYANKDFYLFDSTKTELELVNTRIDEVSAVRTHTRVVTGLERIDWNNLKLRQLQGGCDRQRLLITFKVISTVEALATTANNNVRLYTDADGDQTFAPGDTLHIRWDASTGYWEELDRRQSYQLPFGPEQVVGFRSWYKSNAGFWQNSSKTTEATTAGQDVSRWVVGAGTGPDLEALSDGQKPTRAAGGGIVGNGSNQGMIIPSINLNGPYTILLRHAAPDTYFSLHRFMSLNMGASNYQIFSSNSLLSTSAFYENVDGSSVYVLTTDYSQDVIIAVAVAADGTTTGYKNDGTTISMGNTARSATSVLYLLNSLATNFDGTKAVRDLVIFDSVISQSDFQQLQAYLS